MTRKEAAIITAYTGIFVSKNMAYKYYKTYGLTRRDVDRLEKNGEIEVGKSVLMDLYPDCDFMVDSDGRYFVKVTCEDDEPCKLTKKEQL